MNAFSSFFHSLGPGGHDGEDKAVVVLSHSSDRYVSRGILCPRKVAWLIYHFLKVIFCFT